MSNEFNIEIIKELREINEKLDKLKVEQNKGLSSVGKLVALSFGFLVLPIIFSIIIPLINKIFG
ncbi:hypothetical protein ACFVRR_03895 [Gottfriedia sp. NPDC057948]|uniref:hypothetical protein n=1 Tax=Gottfriedia sp. NPDC057948 TaxID=3346287 RepID=UPI0036DB0427